MKKYIALTISIISLILFLIILVNLKSSFLSSIDNSLSSSVISIRTPQLTSFFIYITDIGDIKFISALSMLLFLMLISRKRFSQSFLFAGAMSTGAAMLYLTKIFVHRARPLDILVQESSSGFPSGHSMMSLLFFSLIILMFKDKIKNSSLRILFISLSIIFILLIGFSRIYLGAHYPSDVLAGFLLGLFMFFTSISIFRLRK